MTTSMTCLKFKPNLFILEEYFDSKSSDSGNDLAAATMVLFLEMLRGGKCIYSHPHACLQFLDPYN